MSGIFDSLAARNAKPACVSPFRAGQQDAA